MEGKVDEIKITNHGIIILTQVKHSVDGSARMTREILKEACDELRS